MRQLIEPNLSIPYVGGLCEGFVEGMWGQATLPTRDHQMTYGVYGNAVSPINAWETGKWDSNPGNGNHPNELPPMGVKVPVYFWIGSTPAGHTATSLGDGTYLSSSLSGFKESGYHHPSLDHLINFYGPANGGCRYLGYSTHVGNIKVVEEDEVVTNESCYVSFNGILMRPPNEYDLNTYVGKYTQQSLDALLADYSINERRAVVDTYGVGQQAIKDGWSGQIYDLNKQVADLTKQLENCKSKPCQETTNSDTELAKDTNTKVNKIWSFLTSIFAKKD